MPATQILNTAPLPGLPATGYDPAYGGIPTTSDPGASANAAIFSNLGNLSSLFNLGSQVNQFGAQQAAGQYGSNLPGYQQMQEQSSQNILSDLSGVVSPDVANLLTQTAAERGTSSGIGGSPNSGAALLRALGLTSDALKARGQGELTSAIQRTPTSPLFNVASMMISPNDQQAAQMYANLMAAAPNPRAAADEAMHRAMEALKAGQEAAGGRGGGGGGGAAGGGGFSPPGGTGPALQASLSRGGPIPVYGGTGGIPPLAPAVPTRTGTPIAPAAPAVPNPYGFSSPAGPLPETFGAPITAGAPMDLGTTSPDSSTADYSFWYDQAYGPGSYATDYGAPAPVGTPISAGAPLSLSSGYTSPAADASSGLFGGSTDLFGSPLSTPAASEPVDQYGFTQQDYLDAMFGDTIPIE